MPEENEDVIFLDIKPDSRTGLGFPVDEASQKRARLVKLEQEASELKRELEVEASQHAAATRPPQEHSTAKLGTLSPHTPRGRTALSLAKTASPRKATQPKGLMATKAEVIKSIWSKVTGNMRSIEMGLFNLDTSRTGHVSPSAFMGVLNQSGIILSPAQSRELLALIQPKGCATVPIIDFLAIFTVSRMPSDGGAASMAAPQPLSRPATSRPATGALGAGIRPMTSMAGGEGGTGGAMPLSKKSGIARQTAIANASMLADFAKIYRQKLTEMCMEMDSEGLGTLSGTQIRTVFYRAGLPMENDQFIDTVSIAETPTISVGGELFVEWSKFLSKLCTLSLEMPTMFGSLTSIHFAPRHLVEVIGKRIRERYRAALAVLAEEDDGSGDVDKTAILKIIKVTGLEISEAQLDEALEIMGVDTHFPTMGAHDFLRCFVPEHPGPKFREVPRDLMRSKALRTPKEMSMMHQDTTSVSLKQLQEKCLMHVASLRKMFLRMDQNKDGNISVHELFLSLRYLNIFLSKEQTAELFKLCDVDNCGCIRYRAFLSKLAPQKSEIPQPKVYPHSKERLPTATRHRMFQRFIFAEGGGASRPSTGAALSPGQVLDVVRKGLVPNRASVEAMLSVIHRESVPRDSFASVCRRFGVYLTRDNLATILTQLGMGGAQGDIKYRELLRKLEGGTAGGGSMTARDGLVTTAAAPPEPAEAPLKPKGGERERSLWSRGATRGGGVGEQASVRAKIASRNGVGGGIKGVIKGSVTARRMIRQLERHGDDAPEAWDPLW